MGNMGGTRSIKGIAAPPFWPIERKLRPWTPKPSPGPHNAEQSLPLLVVLRDMLKYAETGKEAIKIINENKIKVDGRVVNDYKYPLSVMDVLEIPENDEYYRVIPYPTDYLGLYKITKEEASLKPVRIENKTIVKGGNLQLNLSGGRNILVKFKEGEKKEVPYKTLDTLLITLPNQEIKEHIPFQIGDYALVIWGKNVGKLGKIVSVNKQWGRKSSTVTLEGKSGRKIQTILDYILIVGKEKPVISLPGEIEL
ncbi:ribosomal protein S4E [Caldisphaera lagunensis DSM 15908]|uniref:Small ribosomal subunit protein eS4 n=1 Tax=Caldisphaera lagunensis (strain DSM 15908 / JCM 11604 / ANMR 0165 / IC-154) TaxID=1056495 RepID=L0AB13_CALLD|nr:30S ribosomal protein S4e [Caldisphaera lagunensis]AFZ71088.1 ribosomal protein S4E [Caldisphaera lagunensis DSM 15908]